MVHRKKYLYIFFLMKLLVVEFFYPNQKKTKTQKMPKKKDSMVFGKSLYIYIFTIINYLFLTLYDKSR